MANAALTGLVIAGVLALVARRVDVRIALAVGALPLFAVAGRFGDYFGVMARELANPATIVPIGSALGFSAVLKRTGCDMHLVHLLLRPLQGARWLMIPGGIAAGYLLNTTVVSQTGAAGVLGAVLIPLLTLNGVAPATAGAVLLLGCSMGGELFNPGAVEIRTLSDLSGQSSEALIARMRWLNWSASGTALLVFWALHGRLRGPAPAPREASEPEGPGVLPFRVNPIKALVPAIPIALLYAFPTLVRLPAKEFPRLSEPATILAAMLVGVVAAGLMAPRAGAGLAAAFFEGAGYAYTHVISLIVTATLFAEGVGRTGLIDALTPGLAGRPVLARSVGLTLPWALAAVTGTGIAPAVTFLKILIPRGADLGLTPPHLGGLIAMGAHFGRTMSPAAAVVLLSAQLAGASPAALLKQVAPPLFAGGAVLLAASLAGLV